MSQLALFDETPAVSTIQRSAEFSPCRTYRYRLFRVWDPSLLLVNWIMLNPSDADEEQDDNTSSKTQRFTRRWGGFGGIVLTNANAFCATDPKDMKAARDPVGPENDRILQETASFAGLIVIAWGKDGAFGGRSAAVRKLLAGHRLHYLRLCQNGEPWHPLYLPESLTPQVWEVAP